MRLVPLEAVERRIEHPVRQCSEPGNPHVDADRATLRNGLRNLAFGLDTHEPLAARLAHGDVFQRAQHFPAVTVTQPAKNRRLFGWSSLIRFGSG